MAATKDIQPGVVILREVGVDAATIRLSDTWAAALFRTFATWNSEGLQSMINLNAFATPDERKIVYPNFSYINHSCSPNAFLWPNGLLIAAMQIKTGTTDRAKSPSLSEVSFVCR